SYKHAFTKNMTVINIACSRTVSRVSIGFSCAISEIQNTGHSRCISPWFRSIFRAPSLNFKILAIHDVLAHEFLSVFRAPSRKFKILVFPVLLAHRKSYKHAFAKNTTVINIAHIHALSRVSIGFSCAVSEIQNNGHSRCIMVRRMSMVSRKNVTVINFAQSRVSIGFSCTVSEIQNTGLSRLISPLEVVQARFHKKIRRS
ncbi:hypothetical protein B296_00058143, partial [Ensete ventricosum]